MHLFFCCAFLDPIWLLFFNKWFYGINLFFSKRKGIPHVLNAHRQQWRSKFLRWYVKFQWSNYRYLTTNCLRVAWYMEDEGGTCWHIIVRVWIPLKLHMSTWYTVIAYTLFNCSCVICSFTFVSLSITERKLTCVEFFVHSWWVFCVRKSVRINICGTG